MSEKTPKPNHLEGPPTQKADVSAPSQDSLLALSTGIAERAAAGSVLEEATTGPRVAGKNEPEPVTKAEPDAAPLAHVPARAESGASTGEPAKTTPTLAAQIKAQGVEMLRMYATIIKNPTLIFKGFGEVMKDLFYELPKSLLSRNEDTEPRPVAEQLATKSSQALALSEAMTVAGSQLGVLAATQLL